jgi:hypothetical protein
VVSVKEFVPAMATEIQLEKVVAIRTERAAVFAQEGPRSVKP